MKEWIGIKESLSFLPLLRMISASTRSYLEAPFIEQVRTESHGSPESSPLCFQNTRERIEGLQISGLSGLLDQGCQLFHFVLLPSPWEVGWGMVSNLCPHELETWFTFLQPMWRVKPKALEVTGLAALCLSVMKLGLINKVLESIAKAYAQVLFPFMTISNTWEHLAPNGDLQACSPFQRRARMHSLSFQTHKTLLFSLSVLTWQMQLEFLARLFLSWEQELFAHPWGGGWGGKMSGWWQLW